MTEKTVRPHSVLRRTMLVGTAGVLGGAVLRSTPVQSQTGTAPAVAVPGSAPPAARYGDPAWWAQRKEEILEPALEIVDPHHHLWDRGGIVSEIAVKPTKDRAVQRLAQYPARDQGERAGRCRCPARIQQPGRRQEHRQPGRGAKGQELRLWRADERARGQVRQRRVRNDPDLLRRLRDF